MALSGGGHRACLFALGALLYLVDSGRNGRLASVSSVSGGSLANGALAQSVDLTRADRQDIEAVIADVAGTITGRGTLFGAWTTFAYLTLILLATVSIVVATFVAPLAGTLRVLVLLVGAIAIGWSASFRGGVCAIAFDRTLFRPNGSSTRLGTINNTLDHVFCATDLHAGEHVYFSGGFVYSYRFGLGIPGDVKLSTVVQASAAFPGAFPASWLPTKRHHFRGGAQPEAATTRRMALVDGGVYDNMADQWAQGMENRRPHLGDAGNFRQADELVVVNASAGLEWGRLRGLRLPTLGELLTLLRDKSVLYDNGNSLRRQALYRQFVQSQETGRSMRGALVHIPQSPFRVADALADSSGPSAERARDVQRTLTAGSDSETMRVQWQKIARDNSNVPTTLASFDVETASRLLHHAYVLTMTNLHVILDYPLLEMPDPKRFAKLASGVASNDPCPTARS